MRAFVDASGKSWPVAVNVEALRRARDLAATDLMGVLSGPLLTDLARDYVLLCDVLFAVLKPEADRRGVAREEFSEAMSGESLDAGLDALLGELADFFPPPSRTRLTMAWGLAKQLREIESRIAERRLSAINIEEINIEESAGQAPATAGGSSGNSPESAASTPAP